MPPWNNLIHRILKSFPFVFATTVEVFIITKKLGFHADTFPVFDTSIWYLFALKEISNTLPSCLSILYHEMKYQVMMRKNKVLSTESNMNRVGEIIYHLSHHQRVPFGSST